MKSIMRKLGIKKDLPFRSRKRYSFLILALFLSVANYVIAQDTSKIEGIVLDEIGEPIIGASIRSEKDNNGTITDIEGKFSYKYIEGDQLTFSYLGYKAQKIRLTENRFLRVVMEPDQSILDEVVVVGYGTLSKREVTTSISKVTGSDLNKVVNTSVSTALKGKTTGLRVYNSSGAPGTQASITIRGGSSINKSNEALILVDGMPGALSGINPQDVESIEVLKDAASTAIYGARASNGIVLITTKSGTKGKPTVTANVSYGYQNTTKKMDKLGAIDYLNLTRPALARSPYANLLDAAHPAGTGNGANSSFSTRYLKHGEIMPTGWKWMYDPLYPEDPTKVLIFEDNDLQDDVFEGGTVLNAYLSLSGSSDKLRYMISLGYVGDNGFTPNRDWKSLTLRSNTTYNIAKNIRLTSNISAQRFLSNPYASESAIFSTGIHLAPTIKKRMEDGTYAPGKDAGYRNPLYIIDNIHNERIDYRAHAKLGFEWDIIKDLTAKVEGFHSFDYVNREYFERKNFYNSLRPSNFYGDQNQKTQFDLVVNYAKTFSENHKISAVAGASTLYYNIYSNSALAEGSSRDDLMTANVSSKYNGIDSTREKERLNSVFGRISYSYMMKYLLGLTLRADASSKFADGHRWGYFPGISAGYVMSEENFMKDINWLSLLKFRGSYGLTGNNSVGRYTYQGVWSPSESYMGEAGFTPSSIPNRTLTWENSKQLDLGIEIGLLKNRINLAFDFYNKLTQNLLFTENLPNTSGFGSIEKNVGEVKFWGYEALIDATIIDQKDITFSIGANISYNMNKVLRLPPNGKYRHRMSGLEFADDYYAGIGGLAEGERMYGVIGYKVSHILDTDEEAANAFYDERAGGWDPATKTFLKGRKIAGDYEWVDKNKDGKITSKDQYVLGYLVPTTTGGFNTSFRFKNWELYASFDYALGHVIYDRQVSLVNAMAQSGYLTPTVDVLNSWAKPGDASNTKFARFDINDSDNNGQWNYYRTSDINTYKGDYLSFRELKIGYNVPKSFLSKLKLSTFQIYASGQNIYTFSGYPGYVTEYSGKSRNIGDGNFPSPRIWTIGINTTF